MLDRAHRLRAEGIDVVGAFVETHRRADTERLIGDLEILPRKTVIHEGTARVKTLEGELTVSLDDWIIKGVKGEIYPCKPDIFEATYEPVQENS
mgnify:CR=1 FL=1